MNKTGTLSPKSPKSPQAFEEGYKQQLSDVKSIRKRAEEEAQLLANRIALLQLEEQKTMKKVEETRKKAQDIMDQKQRNIMLAKQKAELRREREEEERRKMEQNRSFKELIKAGQEQKKVQLHKGLHDEVKTIKQNKKEYLEQHSIKMNDEQLRNSQVFQKIKLSERELQEKKRQQYEQVRERARQEYEKKVQHQMMMRQDTHKIICELEEREKQLLMKLQNTQGLQKRANDELERAMVSPSFRTDKSY